VLLACVEDVVVVFGVVALFLGGRF